MPPPSAPTIEDLLLHAPFVRAVARAAVRGDTDVDDIVQSTYLASLEHGPAHGASVRGWLATVTRNAARGLGRTEGRRRRREARAARPEELPSTSEIVAKEEIRRKLLEAVLGLDEPYRSALLLRYYEDLSAREVASRLGVPLETARTRIKRGLGHLRERLDGAWGGNRRAWMAAVAPLAGTGLQAAAASVVGVGLLWKAAVVVLLGGLVTYAVLARSPKEEPLGTAPGTEVAAADAGPRLAPAPGAPLPRGGGSIRGEVARDPGEGDIVVGVAYVSTIDAVFRSRFSGGSDRWLRIVPYAEGSPSTTTVGVDGTFHFEDLAEGIYLVGARTADGHADIRPVALTPDGATTVVALDLTRGEHELEGRILWADGRPFDGWVMLQKEGQGPVGSLTLTAPCGPPARRIGPGGSFCFEHIPPGMVGILAFEPGVCLHREGRIRIPVDAPIEITVGSTTTIQGLVLDAQTGDPIGGANVFQVARFGNDSSFEMASMQTDSLGRFTACGFGASARFVASADGYATAPEPSRGDDGPVTIRLDRTFAVQGRVVTPEGTGVEGVAVSVLGLSERARLLPGRVPASTDADGRFHLRDLPPGDVMVFAHGNGWISEHLSEVRRGGYNPLALTGAPGDLLDIERVVVPAAAVCGRVVGPDGRLMSGGIVFVKGEPWPNLPGIGLHAYGNRVTTDDEGRFHIDTVLPGTGLEVVVRSPLLDEVASAPFALASGEVHSVDLALRPIRHVMVVVVDEDGTPVPGAGVFFERRESRSRTTRLPAGAGLAVTRPDGTFRTGPLPEGDVSVGARAEGWIEARPVPVTDVHRSGQRPVRVVLIRGLPIRGRVTGPEGLSPARIHVTVESTGSDRAVSRRARTDEDGAFGVDTLPPGTYRVVARVTCEDETWEGQATVEAGTTDLCLDLERLTPPEPRPSEELTKWVIEILGPNGEAVASLWHRTYRRFPGGAFDHMGTGGGGPGRLTVQQYHGATGEVFVEVFRPADADDRPMPWGAVLVSPRDLPANGGTHTVRLPPESHVEGRLLDIEGKPVAGVPVSAFPRYDDEGLPRVSWDPHAEARTGSNGHFRLGRLGHHGSYELRFELPARYAPLLPVPVDAGDEDVVVRARSGVVATIVVTDGRGRAQGDCRVSADVVGDDADRSRDRRRSGTTNEEGRLVLEGLDPMLRYRLVLTPRNASTDVLVRVIEDWKPGDTDVVLPRAWTISGVVVDETGQPLPHAWVNLLSDPPSGWTQYRADDRGRFSIGGLPGGEVVLRTTPKYALNRYVEGRRETVAVGSEGIRLAAWRKAGIVLKLADADVDPSTVTLRVTDTVSGRETRFHEGFDENGCLDLWGLETDSAYVLYAEHAGEVFYRCEVHPGPEPLRVTFEPARVLVVHLDIPGGLPDGLEWRGASVCAKGPGWRQYGRQQDAEQPTYEIHGVPPGPCTVTARLERSPFSQGTDRVAFHAHAENITEDEIRLQLGE